MGAPAAADAHHSTKQEASTFEVESGATVCSRFNGRSILGPRLVW